VKRSLTFDLSFVEYHLGGGRPSLAPALVEMIGPPRPTDAPILQHHADVAASVQKVLEDAVVFLAKQLRAMTGSRRLCYSGGVALNIDANARIKDEAGFDEIAITPSAYDAGTSIGAALHLHHTRFGRRRVAPLVGAYKGPQYDDAAIAAAFKAAGLTPERVDEPSDAAAQLLADGAVIGWFQGREEIGPRALGNRSILMDPGVPDGKSLINARVKFREAFRPFAPSVPLEDAAQYFEGVCPSPFMLYKFPVRIEWQGRLGAITHVDGSARVHTVTASENGRFHALLKAFGRRRGYSVLLNTSFNVQGQPLVSTPEQAIAVYLQTRMDALVIGPYVVRRDIAADVHAPAPGLPPGVVDPGGAPRGPAVEPRRQSAPYPDGIAITNGEAAAFDAWLAAARRAAVTTPQVSALLQAIARLEGDVWLQSQSGVDHLVGLWQTLAGIFLDSNRVYELTEQTVRDPRLLERGPFPPENMTP
jgi:carbamoyltransferase